MERVRRAATRSLEWLRVGHDVSRSLVRHAHGLYPSFTSKKVSRHFVGGYDNMRLNTHTRETHTRGVRNRTPARERRKKNLLDLFALFAKCRMATLAESIAHLASCLPRMICVTAPVAARVLASLARAALPRGRRRARLASPRVSPIASRGVTLRVSASEDSSSVETVETGSSPRVGASPRRALRGQARTGQTPSTPRSSPRATSPRRCSSPSSRAASPAETSSPRAPPWRRRRSSSAGSAPASSQGDYDSDSPNAALWGTRPVR